MTVYIFKYDGWWDGNEDCPCCSGMFFECYNLENKHHTLGSADSIHECYSQAILVHLRIDDQVDTNPYTAFTLQELMDVCERMSIEVIID